MTIAMLLAILAQAEDPLGKNWKELQEAWQAASKAGGDEDYVADSLLEAAAKVHLALKATGLEGKGLTADRAALRRALKARLMPAVKTRMPRPKEKSRKEAGEERMRKMLEDAFRPVRRSYASIRRR